MKHKFCIGDRVRLIKNHPEGNRILKTGDLGTVCCFEFNSIGVYWDRSCNGHDCGNGGTCASGHGWFVSPWHLELYYEDGEIGGELDAQTLSDLLSS